MLVAMEGASYPQWWRERAQMREARIRASIERLRARLTHIEGVRGALVFGSYARGTVGPTSDIDLIVIQETDVPQVERTANMYVLLACDLPLDLVVYTPTEFERLRTTRNFVRQAAEEGKWIYARASA
jgi:predicted nucleotidyltransferase